MNLNLFDVIIFKMEVGTGKLLELDKYLRHQSLQRLGKLFNVEDFGALNRSFNSMRYAESLQTWELRRGKLHEVM